MTKVIVAAWQRRCLLAFVGVVVVVLCTTRLIPSAYGQASADPSTGISSTSDDPYPKVFGILRQLLQGDPRDTGPLRSLLAPSFGLVRNSLIGVSIQTADTGLTLGALAGIGRAASNVRGTAIELYASASDVLALANRPEIWRVEAIVPPQATVVSQGRTVHNASTWIAGGVTGSGIKVGIIDVGFQNIQNLLGSELPASVTARCYTALGLHLPLLLLCGGSDHGTAVAESLFDVAPGVQLYISQPSSKLDFANTVDWMISEGVTIISHSAVWTWDGPGDGTSPYSDSPLRSVDAAVARGATFVTSAGNAGLATWSGAWRDIDGDNTHEFSSTLTSESNGISLMSGQRVEMHMRWQDSWTAAASDLDIMLVDRNGVARAQATSRQAGRAGNTPSEYFSTIAPGTDTYFIKVVRLAGPAPAWLQVQSFSFIPLQYTTPGSIGNPGESRSPGMLTVGAASWQTPTVIEPFSSVGPTPDGRPKPDIVGADQASTVTYPSFGGTSQAAPHVAGLAALVKSAFPSYTPQQVASFLTSNAQPRGTGRPNSTWGWGFARLPSVCGTTAAPASASFGQGGGSAQFAVTAVRTCSWTASSQVPWATLTSGSSAVGNASVTVNVAPNTGVPRSGTLLLGSASVTITQAGPVAPTTNPRSLTVAVSGNVATLTWLPPDAGTPSGYALEIGTQPGAADLATLQAGSSTYFSFEATPGLYYARVRANVGGTVTPPSNEVSFRIGSAPANPNPVSPPPPPPPPPPSPGPPPTPAPGPPSAPLNLGATTAGGNVSLTWGPPASAVGLLGYQLQAGSAPGRSDLATIIVMAPSLYVPGVGPGVYHVRVRAGNALGIGPPSNEVTVVVPRAQPPGAPTGLTHIVSGSTVTLHWQPPASGGAVSSYYLVAGSQSGLSNLARISIGPLTSLAVPNVPRGVYYVRVVATNAVGSSALSSNEVVVVVGGG